MARWKKIGRTIFTHAAVAAAASIGTAIYILYPTLAGMEACQDDITSLPPNCLGDAIEIKEQTCDGPVHSVVISLTLIDHSWHWRHKFFAYEWAGDSEPHVSWTNDRELLVRVGEASYISTQREKTSGINIRYEIKKISP